MADDATLDVMIAITTRLMADAQVTALVGSKIYDTAPEGVSGPYVTIGQSSYFDSSTDSSAAQDIRFDIHCFDIPADRSNAKDTSKVRALLGHVRRLFHDYALAVPGRNRIVSQVIAASPVFADADEIHGVATLRILIGHE
jgi:hypothetical protein